MTQQYYSLVPLTDLADPLWKGCGVYVTCDALGFVICLVTGTHVHLDLIGTGAFVVATWSGMALTAPHIGWSSYATVIWATKLTSIFFSRLKCWQ
jgi:hypothetical protein